MRSAIALALLALVAGLALGRFLYLDRPSEAGTSNSSAQAQGPGLASTQVQVAQLRAAVAADPQDLRAVQRLGAAATDAAVATGDPAYYNLAAGSFDSADALAADDPDTLVGRGRLALSLHRFADALALGERAVAARPDHAASLGVVVDALVELGRYDQAAETLQRMLDRSPDLPALARASYLRELSGDLPGAALALRQAESAGSGSSLDVAVVAALSGDLALRRGDVAAAERGYERAASAEPGLPAVAVGRARVLAARGDLDGAADLLVAAGERQPSPPVVILAADLLRLAGRDADAAAADEVVRAVAALSEAGGQVVDLELARFEADRGGDPAAALSLARAAHDARPDNVFAADTLAWALHRGGDTAAARPLVERALRLGGADAGMLVRAALVLDAAGDPAAATEQLSAALNQPPATAVAQHRDALALAGRLAVPVPPAWALP